MLDNFKQRTISRYNGADELMSPQRLWQDLNKVNHDKKKSQHEKREVGTKLYPQTRSYPQIIAAEKGKIFFFFLWSDPVPINHTPR